MLSPASVSGIPPVAYQVVRGYAQEYIHVYPLLRRFVKRRVSACDAVVGAESTVSLWPALLLVFLWPAHFHKLNVM